MYGIAATRTRGARHGFNAPFALATPSLLYYHTMVCLFCWRRYDILLRAYLCRRHAVFSAWRALARTLSYLPLFLIPSFMPFAIACNSACAASRCLLFRMLLLRRWFLLWFLQTLYIRLLVAFKIVFLAYNSQ
jgi:hypothetical protein